MAGISSPGISCYHSFNINAYSCAIIWPVLWVILSLVVDMLIIVGAAAAVDLWMQRLLRDTDNRQPQFAVFKYD